MVKRGEGGKEPEGAERVRGEALLKKEASEQRSEGWEGQGEGEGEGEGAGWRKTQFKNSRV